MWNTWCGVLSQEERGTAGNLRITEVVFNYSIYRCFSETSKCREFQKGMQRTRWILLFFYDNAEYVFKTLSKYFLKLSLTHFHNVCDFEYMVKHVLWINIIIVIYEVWTYFFFNLYCHQILVFRAWTVSYIFHPISASCFTSINPPFYFSVFIQNLKWKK